MVKLKRIEMTEEELRERKLHLAYCKLQQDESDITISELEQNLEAGLANKFLDDYIAKLQADIAKKIVYDNFGKETVATDADLQRMHITIVKFKKQKELDIPSRQLRLKINKIRDAMEGMLSPDIVEEITGNAEIRETYKISKVGTIARCMVTDGKIFRNSRIRIIRDSVVVFSGELASLKRFKDDAKEVAKGYDCGMQIKNYNDIKELDVIEAYQEVAVKKKLK